MTAPAGRLAIIAGRGRLPEHIAAAARRGGADPLVIALKGESDREWAGYDCERLSISDLRGARAIFERYGIDRVVLSGGVNRRPEFRESRPTWRSLGRFLEVLRALAGSGDDRMLRLAISLLEGEGVKVISAQEVVPGLLAEPGPLGRHTPGEADLRDIARAREAALALGQLDIGQGAVSVGGRVVAVEGLEGTDAMLSRVADLRESGRLTRRHAGVLVKMCKPDQDLRADLPSVGPETVKSAQKAGLAGIAVEAGRSLVLDRPETVAAADAAGLFVTGTEAEEAPA